MDLHLWPWAGVCFRRHYGLITDELGIPSSPAVSHAAERPWCKTYDGVPCVPYRAMASLIINDQFS